MRAYNGFWFEGWLGKDAELQTSQGGTKYRRLWISRTNRWKDNKTGEQREHQDDINGVLFGEAAENFEGIQGDRVFVRGELKTEEYEGKKRQGLKFEYVDVTMSKQRRLDLQKPADGKEDDDLPF